MVSVVNWSRDKKGALAIQSLFFIIIFILIVYMAFEIWKVVSIRQTLHAATYQAAKWISLNGLKCVQEGCQYGLEGYVTRFIVEPELRNNSFTDDPHPAVNVHIDYEPDDYCDNPFTIKVQMLHSVLVPPRYGQVSGEMLLLTLSRTLHGQLVCLP